MKLASLLTSVALLGAPSPNAMAAGPAPAPELGLSGLFDVDAATWSGLDSEARLAFVGARADLARTLGVHAVRIGPGGPEVFSESALQGTFPWIFADRVVGALGERDLDFVVTLKQLVPASQKGAYRQFMTRFIERYDGDADFGVTGAEVQFNHPDVDASGSVSVLDWDAAGAAKATWAAQHRMLRLEVGDRVRVAEDAGAIVAADYAAQLGAVQQAVSGSDAAVAVELAGTDMDKESKNRFVERLVGVDAATLEAAGAHLRDKLAELDGAKASAALDNFVSWLREAGLNAVEPWITEMSVGSAPAGSGPGPCRDARCSERTQVHGLVRAVLSAFARGYTRVYYAGAVEVEGSATTVGLVTVAPAKALRPTAAELAPRAAYAVWRRLPELVGGGAVEKLGGLPTNVSGVRLATGYALWFDWTLEVGPGQGYDAGRRKEVVLRGLTSPALRVVSLWPRELGATLGTDGAVEAVWDEVFVPVVDDGTAVITVGQDPVWVTPSDGTATAEPEPGDVVEAPVGDDVAEGAAGPPVADGGGCHGGSLPLGGFAGVSVVLLLAIARRRRGAHV